jgi:pyruvate,water dikinase
MTLAVPTTAPRTAARYVCPLAAAAEVPGCGGKAVRLAQMLRLGLPVPAGVVVTDRAFQEFLDANALREVLQALTTDLDPRRPELLRVAAQAIAEKVCAAPLPPHLQEAIAAGLAELRLGTPLVVRSSALGEDGERASFAGQLDSFLNVDPVAGWHDALRRGWASHWSERVLAYQRTRGAELRGMGVVLQEQVPAKLSGVLFTRSPDPRDGGADVLAVEYVYGLGDALVSGRINPGRFSIGRRDCRRRSHTPPEQVAADGALEETLIAELAGHGLALEEAFGGPQDIEWAADAGGRLWLLQARPITVPGPVPNRLPGPTVVWTNANVNENFPEPISPLLYSIAAAGYYHYFRGLGRAFGIAARRIEAMDGPLRHLVGVHGGRLYYNLTNLHTVLRLAPFGEVLADFFNRFVGATQTPTPHIQVRRGRLTQLVEATVVALKTTWQFLFLTRRVRIFERTADAYAARTEPDGLARRSRAELLDSLRAFLDIRCRRWTNAGLADAAAMISYGLLERLLRREFPAADLAALHNTLLKGLPDLVSGLPAVRLWELSRFVRSDAALAERFTAVSGPELLREIRERPEFAAFRTVFEAYLAEWGFRCPGELMLTWPSYQEEPARLLDVIRAYAGNDRESPLDLLERQGRERIAQTQRVLGELRRRRLWRWLPWPTRVLPVRLVLAWAQRAIALRERARLKQALLYSRCRHIVLALGACLMADGTLERSEDLFYLAYSEIDDLLAGGAMFPDQVRDLVRLRRAGQARLHAMQPPDAFELPDGEYCPPAGQPTPALEARTEGRTCGSTPARRASEGRDVALAGASGWSDAEAPPQSTSPLLSGLGACGGRVEGPAAVLQDVRELGRLQEGAVLVTRQTDPGWGPVFFLIKGLVLERGGMLSHGAILAREYGIPTVVGVKDATKRIADGQQVRVDGDRGLVSLA